MCFLFPSLRAHHHSRVTFQDHYLAPAVAGLLAADLYRRGGPSGPLRAVDDRAQGAPEIASVLGKRRYWIRCIWCML